MIFHIIHLYTIIKQIFDALINIYKLKMLICERKHHIMIEVHVSLNTWNLQSLIIHWCTSTSHILLISNSFDKYSTYEAVKTNESIGPHNVLFLVYFENKNWVRIEGRAQFMVLRIQSKQVIVRLKFGEMVWKHNWNPSHKRGQLCKSFRLHIAEIKTKRSVTYLKEIFTIQAPLTHHQISQITD